MGKLLDCIPERINLIPSLNRFNKFSNEIPESITIELSSSISTSYFSSPFIIFDVLKSPYDFFEDENVSFTILISIFTGLSGCINVVRLMYLKFFPVDFQLDIIFSRCSFPMSLSDCRLTLKSKSKLSTGLTSDLYSEPSSRATVCSIFFLVIIFAFFLSSMVLSMQKFCIIEKLSS